MQELSLYQFFTDKFNSSKIPYAVTGSVASIIYGQPRMTHDVDIVINLNINRAKEFLSLFPADEFYCPPVEILKTEILKNVRGHCNLIHNESGFKADIYFCGTDEFQKWALTNAKHFDFNNRKIAVAPPEYVIIKKLEFYKEGKSSKHLDDIKAILFNSKEVINFPVLQKYISEFGLNKEWELFSGS